MLEKRAAGFDAGYQKRKTTDAVIAGYERRQAALQWQQSNI
jgi:hypothetical protein